MTSDRHPPNLQVMNVARRMIQELIDLRGLLVSAGAENAEVVERISRTIDRINSVSEHWQDVAEIGPSYIRWILDKVDSESLEAVLMECEIETRLKVWRALKAVTTRLYHGKRE